MRFYTENECEEWLRGRERRKPKEIPEIHRELFAYPPEGYRYFHLAHWVASSLVCRRPALLWIQEWGIWPSNENWHLYYKLRQTYGDQRLLPEAPGHLFLEHESEDLATFLQVAMLNGWGGYILIHAGDVNAFFSHDMYIEFFAEKSEYLDEVRNGLAAYRAKSG